MYNFPFVKNVDTHTILKTLRWTVGKKTVDFV